MVNRIDTLTVIREAYKLRDRIVHVNWRIWMIVGLSVAVLDNLAVRSVPEYPDFYSGNIVYFWAIGSGTVELVLIGVGLCCLIGLGITQTLPSSGRKVLAIGLVMTICIFSVCNIFVSFNPRSLTHKSSGEFAGNTYNLAISSGSTEDYDATIAVFIVYKCDKVGIICHKYFTPPDLMAVGQAEIQDAMRQETDFIVDSTDGNLYVKIGTDRWPVHYNQYGPEEDYP